MKLSATGTDSFVERMKEIVADSGGMKAFSEKVGVSYSSVRKYLNGTDPSRAVVARIVTTYKVNSDWLLNGVGPKSQAAKGGAEPESAFLRQYLKGFANDPDVVAEICSGARLEAGRLISIANGEEPSLSEAIRISEASNLGRVVGGGVSEEPRAELVWVPEFDLSLYREILLEYFDFREEFQRKREFLRKSKKKGAVVFRREFLRQEFSGDLHDLVCYRMDNDSMFPDAPRGSILFLDISRTNLENGRMFLLYFNGSLLVREARDTGVVASWELHDKRSSKPIQLSNTELSDNNIVVGMVTHAFKSCG
ncbi:helix-turn-helix transcriptional regulator [Pelagicoccus sp. SDUM812005]|uniref:LexA family transcriptional regulator n=1 Tax=Pelagicoccus sp. SDUM812005 TaxID=3041257 RepID=UPI00280E18D6|nr:helix-turn-helix transcriptional regulator [Pelagicoccus sp. SDUM812005]MDQ8180372.1 helix-turn-helix transcriptional regulator [Pelagicoccus sp. SDUM812005]